MICNKCGKEIPDNVKFCPKCGNKLGDGGHSIDPRIFQNGAANAGMSQELQSPKSGNAKKIALIVGLIAIALLLIGLLVFLFTSTEVGTRVQKVISGNIKQVESDIDAEDDLDGNYDDDEEEQESEEEQEVDNKEFTGVKKNVNIDVRQVDSTNFPEVTLYANVISEDGSNVESLEASDLVVKEISWDGATLDASIEDVYRLINNERININLVMDQSGSMGGSKMTQAKNAAYTLLNNMTLDSGDRVEVISFDDYVYLQQEFTSQGQLLYDAIDGIYPNGSTALLDAIYAGVYQTFFEDGAKCVIAFTDGAENASSYSYEDVVEISRNTGIPVYIIGIGDGYDSSMLQNLAYECSGRYYSADTNDLQTILEDIYLSIYREQQDYYVIRYTSKDTKNLTEFRQVVVETAPESEFSGTFTKTYVPQVDITGAFSSSYADRDFMIDDSDTRILNESDLHGMSLAQLRIARNEIFARHGRQFKDPLLNQWFYSKTWYLNIGAKYSPNDFDAIRPSPLSKIEIQNCEFIKNYEDNKISTEDIFPNAATETLSEYDLALTDAVLKTALAQLNTYPSNSTLEINIERIREAIDKEDINY